MNRMKWAAYGAAASGGVTSTVILARIAIEWAITNLPGYLPYLVTNIRLLLTFIGL